MTDTTADTTHETAQRLRRAVTRLNRRLRSSSLGGISPAQASMLSSIGQLGSPSLGELAAAELVRPPSITRVVRAMEKAGLVRTTPDERDRRSTRVALTATGRQELAAIRRRKTEFLEATLLALDPSERRRAEEAVAFLERLVERS